MKIFEDKLAKTNSGFFVGKSLTYADLALFWILEWLKDRHDSIFPHFPLLKAHNHMVATIPSLAQHIATRPVTPF